MWVESHCGQAAFPPHLAETHASYLARFSSVASPDVVYDGLLELLHGPIAHPDARKRHYWWLREAEINGR